MIDDGIGKPSAGVDAPGASAAEYLLERLSAAWTTQVLYVAVELGLPEQLAPQPRTSVELAERAGCHEPSLRRLLRALTTLGVLYRSPDDRYALTSVGQLLRRDLDESLSSWVLWWGRSLWPAWGHLAETVRSGTSGRALATGHSGFEHLNESDAARTFYRATVELSRLTAPIILSRYDFSRFRQIVDVGGGYGELLAWILRTNPTMRGVLFEIAFPLDGAREHLRNAGVLERCDLVQGDFFVAVPEGADAYLLKSVLHDWDDRRATLILQNVRRAMGNHSRLILIEHLLPEDGTPAPSGALADLTMLVAHAAGERTRSQLDALLAENSLSVRRIEPLKGELHLIEAEPLGP